MSLTVNNQIYDELAGSWWDEDSFLHLLKSMVNPWRVPYFKSILVRQYGQGLSPVSLLDIGCGGGVLTEEFARLGCHVTGIDMSRQSIVVAQSHALLSGFSIDYRVGTGTNLPFDNGSFDVVSCCDVLEHIQDWEQVIAEAARVLKPGGIFIFDTINRTLQSKAVMIFGLQQFPLTKLMPADTHIWEMFITPQEIRSAFHDHGFQMEGLMGSRIAKDPLSTLLAVWQRKLGRITFAEFGRRLELKLDTDLSLNYLGYALKTR